MSSKNAPSPSKEAAVQLLQKLKNPMTTARKPCRRVALRQREGRLPFTAPPLLIVDVLRVEYSTTLLGGEHDERNSDKVCRGGVPVLVFFVRWQRQETRAPAVDNPNLHQPNNETWDGQTHATRI
jgi:hypothetical protein